MYLILMSNYNSNLENKVNTIQLKQILNNSNKSEYLNQFDELTFDNIGEPTAENDIYKTISGINFSLERNINFRNGFSDFQKSDMHYDVVNNNDFIFNNMTPNTSRRDFSIDDRSSRRLETFTGNFKEYTSKTEKTPLFKPDDNISNIYGMPSITNMIENRYLPSNKNNFGDLPFENKVRI